MAQVNPTEPLGATVDLGSLFGTVRLIDRVSCGDTTDAHRFTEGPVGASRVETILGQACRVLPVEGAAKYFAYRLGEGKGLRVGAAYVLAVEYPEDQPRTFVVQNRGAEYARGVYTGQAIGDVLYTYTNNNCESLRVPLTGRFEAQRSLFFLHEHLTEIFQPRGIEPDERGTEDEKGMRPLSPADGFWVVVTQSRDENIPLGGGAAVASIRLYEVADVDRLYADVKFPPAGLPRRHLFFREEMSDGIINSRNPTDRGVEDQTRWFEHKARLMRVLGVNTWAKDILEFGGNPPFDTTYRGNDAGDRWYRQTRFPTRWADQLAMLAKYGIDVLPYTEYAGSDSKIDGLGREKRCHTLAGTNTYTHIVWSEKYNADVTDPDTFEDVRKLLDSAILRHKGVVPFVGIWFRTRPSHLSMSFSDRCLGLFADAANDGQPITRDQLRADAALYERYRAWWFEQRKAFLLQVRDYLRQQGVDDAVVLFTADSTEPGVPLRGGMTILDENLQVPAGKIGVVTDDVETWRRILANHPKAVAIDINAVIANDLHLTAATSPQPTWGDWEWQHSVPEADPQRYKDVPGVMMTLPFNRAYMVGSPRAFDAFRTPSGGAMIHHAPLNENSMHKELGYFVADMERSRMYSMLSEARAVAFGDPWYIGYMHANSFNRGFPEYVRDFNTNFLALPALPSAVLSNAASDDEVVVRQIDAREHGSYLVIVNVGLTDKTDVTVRLPQAGTVLDAVTGAKIETVDQTIQLSLRACQLRSLRIVG
ncbi:MAG TPA: hypothetical protein VGN72_19380 [Tepidisphaeraceae bacterium]|jgi:hypothetical protein|nr:hypothetical protein [Tepidisphaeraceae bacterium]